MPDEMWDKFPLRAAIVGIVLAVACAATLQQIRTKQARRSVASGCISNLRSLDGAKATWALETRAASNAVPTDSNLFGPTLYMKEKPNCPLGGVYTLGALGEKPRCSVPGHTL